MTSRTVTGDLSTSCGAMVDVQAVRTAMIKATASAFVVIETADDSIAGVEATSIVIVGGGAASRRPVILGQGFALQFVVAEVAANSVIVDGGAVSRAAVILGQGAALSRAPGPIG